jgi:hypothetical protein
MLAKTYNAFKAAGVPEAEAQAAAEAPGYASDGPSVLNPGVAGYENRLGGVENRSAGSKIGSPRLKIAWRA